jgi:hypothetical protein
VSEEFSGLLKNLRAEKNRPVIKVVPTLIAPEIGEPITHHSASGG